MQSCVNIIRIGSQKKSKTNKSPSLDAGKPPVKPKRCMQPDIDNKRLMDKNIQQKLDSYPNNARNQFMKIRGLIFEVADEEQLGEITETLKWGEPSYSSKLGSPIRMDWKPKTPDQISIYFNCKTILVETFREIYKDTFLFIGTRELVLPLSGPIPTLELKGCISIALRYHKVKHLPLLGA